MSQDTRGIRYGLAIVVGAIVIVAAAGVLGAVTVIRG